MGMIVHLLGEMLSKGRGCDAGNGAESATVK